jgi:exo-poly-alpha-galacturonosidase
MRTITWLIALLLAATAVPAAATGGPHPPPPQALRVPTLARDDHTITLAWRDPADRTAVTDYHVYRDGRLIGSASQDPTATAKPYLDTFYANPASASQLRVLRDTFTATGLAPATRYRFTVRSVDAQGRESRDSAPLFAATTQPSRVFDVTDFGAVGDGKTLATQAIQAAIDACSPGGTVLIPPGTFLSGALWLKSDMTFKVAAGATLLGSPNAEDYPYHFTLYPYSTDERFYSLINAHTYDYGTLHDIRIVGPGTIDGNGWRQQPPDAEGFPVSAPSSSATVAQNGILAAAQVARASQLGSASPYGTRSSLITTRGVDNLYFGNFTARNPAGHTVVTIRTNHVTVAGVRLETGGINNADGIDFNQGTGLDVYDNVFDTGDDDMNFAAGLGAASATDPPTRDAWIAGNYYRTGHGAVVAGSHTGSWIEDVVAENNVIDRTDVALRMKTDPHNGGGARRILFQNNAVRAVAKQAFIFTSTYADPSAAIVVEPSSVLAYFTDVTVRHVTVNGTGDHAIEITGVPGRPHTDLRFDDVHFLQAKPTAITYLEGATFHDVVFDQTPDPWAISESATLSFPGTTTATAATTDAAGSPRWPASPQATATDTTATLTWPGATDNVAVTHYRILKNGNPVATITGTTYEATGLSPALTYDFAVQAGDGVGDWTTSPPVTVHTTGTPDTIPPAAPATAPTLITTGTTWAELSWPPATDEHGIDHYQVLANGTPTDFSTTTGTLTGLTPGTPYTFTIRALDATGNAASYPATTGTTTKPPYDTGAPTWPRHPTVRATATPTTITLTWTAATDDQQVTGYRLYLNGQPLGAGFTPVNTAGTTTAQTYRITGLTPHTRYTIRIEAADPAGRWTASGPTITTRTS